MSTRGFDNIILNDAVSEICRRIMKSPQGSVDGGDSDNIIINVDNIIINVDNIIINVDNIIIDDAVSEICRRIMESP